MYNNTSVYLQSLHVWSVHTHIRYVLYVTYPAYEYILINNNNADKIVIDTLTQSNCLYELSNGLNNQIQHHYT